MECHLFILPVAALALLFLAGCGALPLNPVTNESRPVQAITDATKTITVPEGIVWYNGPRKTRGIRFPTGRYPLEAQDADYWYFRSPAPLELRTFGETNTAGTQGIAGGLMVARHFSIVPGAGYAEGEGSTKVVLWKLGQDFLALEGKYWIKSY